MIGRLRRLLPWALLLGLTGCGGCSDEPAPPGALTFVADQQGESPAVYLRGRAVRTGLVRVEVVGRGLDDVYGLAFRLEYTSPAVSALEVTPSSFWPADALAAAEQPVSGLLVAGLSRRGDAAGAPASDEPLCTIDFAVSDATPVDFVEAESAVVTSDGSELPGLGWFGGAVVWQ